MQLLQAKTSYNNPERFSAEYHGYSVRAETDSDSLHLSRPLTSVPSDSSHARLPYVPVPFYPGSHLYSGPDMCHMPEYASTAHTPGHPDSHHADADTSLSSLLQTTVPSAVLPQTLHEETS